MFVLHFSYQIFFRVSHFEIKRDYYICNYPINQPKATIDVTEPPFIKIKAVIPFYE